MAQDWTQLTRIGQITPHVCQTWPNVTYQMLRESNLGSNSAMCCQTITELGHSLARRWPYPAPAHSFGDVGQLRQSKFGPMWPALVIAGQAWARSWQNSTEHWPNVTKFGRRCPYLGQAWHKSARSGWHRAGRAAVRQLPGNVWATSELAIVAGGDSPLRAAWGGATARQLCET